MKVYFFQDTPGFYYDTANDTFYVVAHFHIVMGLSAAFGMIAGIYH